NLPRAAIQHAPDHGKPLPMGPTKRVGGHFPSRVSPANLQITTVKTCRMAGGRRVCSYVRGKNLVKTCVSIGPGKQSCKQGPTTRTRLKGGFVANPIPAVGRLYNALSPVPGKGWCSGTLVTVGIVLTAGHCLYENAVDHPDATKGFFPFRDGAMQFVPA